MSNIGSANVLSSETGVSRRGLILGSAAVTAGAAMALSTPVSVAAASAKPAILNAAALHVDLVAKTAKKLGVATSYSGAVSGDGTVRPALTNLFGPILPFAGTSVSGNKLPAGMSWHSEATPKSLVSATADKLVFRAKTTTALPDYFGGVRTAVDVVQPGQTVLLSFRADLSELTGNVNASIRVFLLRISDQKSTVGVRAYNAQETENLQSVIRLKAPTGGSGGYRVVFTVEAGASQAGQQVTVTLGSIVMVPEPASPKIGPRYAAPAYFRDSASSQNLVLSPGAPSGDYHVVIRADQFGWAAEAVTLAGTASKVDLKSLFGSTVNLNVREVYVVAKSKWVRGWLDQLSPVMNWLPSRFLNIDNSQSRARPESPNRLSRITGLPAGVSAASSEVNTNIPTMAAPPVTWAVAYNPMRLSHTAFEADTDKYIGDTGGSAGVRSEVFAGESVPFDKDVWISFWTRAQTTLTDPMYDRYAVMFQFRYVNNATGDSSKLSPDLAFEQLPQDRFRLRYRSDHGKPVLAGSSVDNTTITTGSVDPVPYVKGQWASVVVRVRFSRSGGGHLSYWHNGVQKFNAAVPVGYNRNVGPLLHYGSYKFSDSRSRIEFQHMEHGTRDLSSRIASPLAI